jgi:hypothetical protein
MCLIEGFWLYTKEVAQMKNRKDISHRKAVKMPRRDFMTTAAASSVRAANPSKKFKLNYAPSFGMFRQHAGNDPVDQLKFMADLTFMYMN